MTALTKDNKTAEKLGTEEIPPPVLLALQCAANVQVFAGGMAASDANGRCVPCTSSAALMLWGRIEKGINNLTTNTPYGAAGAQQVPIRTGPYYFTNDGSITAAMIGQPCYAVDDQTVTSNPTNASATYWLPYAGIIMPPGVGDFGNSPDNATRIPVYVGYPSPSSIILHATVDFPLATLQGFTSGTAFSVGPVMPANARLIDYNINVLQALAGNTSDTMTLQGGTDAAGTLIASTSVFTGAAAVISTVGSNPYPSRGGQQLKATLTGGTALSNLTAGHLSVDLFYTIVQ